MPRRVKFVGSVVMDKSGGVLMLHRASPRKQWELPGGVCSPIAPAESVAVEYIKDLLGIQTRIAGTIGNRTQAQGERTVDYTWFAAEIMNGEPRLTDLETYDKWGYFSLVTLSARYNDLSPGTKQLLEAMAYGEIILDI